MFNHLFNSSKRFRDSFNCAVALLALLETVFAVSGSSFDHLWGVKMCWWTKILLVVGILTVLVIVVFMWKTLMSKRGISLRINSMTVYVKSGDLFDFSGWKVISFNENYDTQVDDIIIAHNTINGIFIDKYVDNINVLIDAIKNEVDDFTQYKRVEGKFPLGRIIPYRDYMLLAFTHFTNNSAHLSQKDYEDCLRVMWTEIERTYANRPVALPLLGAGITRFDGTQNKSKTELLKCMLCTLRTSGVCINQPITILLSSDAMDEINLYEFKN